jgi:hypothetical protein
MAIVNNLFARKNVGIAAAEPLKAGTDVAHIGSRNDEQAVRRERRSTRPEQQARIFNVLNDFRRDDNVERNVPYVHALKGLIEIEVIGWSAYAKLVVPSGAVNGESKIQKALRETARSRGNIQHPTSAWKELTQSLR